MKRMLIGVVTSVAMVSLSASAFAQATGTGATGGTGKNNTIEEQTGKATSSAPGSMDTKDVNSSTGTSGSTADVAPGTPDNRNKSPMGTPDPSGPTVK